MSHLVSFGAGALFGAGCVFYVWSGARRAACEHLRAVALRYSFKLHDPGAMPKLLDELEQHVRIMEGR